MNYPWFFPDRQMLVGVLAKHHLNYEDDIEAAFGVFDSDDESHRMRMLRRKSFKMFLR